MQKTKNIVIQTMIKDKVFAHKMPSVKPFEFNNEVAEVFDDMLTRSVPLYGESIRRQAELAAMFHENGTRIYDLGCSHGNLGLLVLDKLADNDVCMIGVDNSVPMLEKYSERLAAAHAGHKVGLVCASLEDVKIANASVVLLNLTLQFVDPGMRDDLIKRIYAGMSRRSILLLTEKTFSSDPLWDDIQTRFYRSFKLDNGYSELEISQKRDALEKVLVPETLETHFCRLENAGFDCVEVWLRWFNFSSLIAIKK